MTKNNQPLLFPHADQYLGVWAILEEHATALLRQAQNINLQLHMEHVATPEAQAEIEERASTDYHVTRDGVAVIKLQGSLTKHAGSMSDSGSMVAARRKVRDAVANQDVASILLHIDSPGGTVAGTMDLADDVASAAKRKPVHAYIEDLGASGAYWIASQATKIYANRGARVGSIGVFAVVPDFSQFAEKEGVKVHVIRFGEMKGAGVEGTAITAEQLEHWQESVDGFGRQFVDAICLGRGLSIVQAEAIADGRVHDAARAVKLKLIDGVQTIDATMAGLVAAGKPQPVTRSKTMSETQDAAPRAATLDELHAELPGASAEFIVSQLKAQASITSAVKAYSAHLAAELQAERTAREASDAKVAEIVARSSQQQPPKARGNQPLPLATEEETADLVDAQSRWDAAINAEIASGKTRPQAVIAVSRKQPQLRNALLAAANA